MGFSPQCPLFPRCPEEALSRGNALFTTESPTPRAGPGTQRCSRDAGRMDGEPLSSSTRLPDAPTAASENSGSQFQEEQSPASHACPCGQTSLLESTRSVCPFALCSTRHGGGLRLSDVAFWTVSEGADILGRLGLWTENPTSAYHSYVTVGKVLASKP